MTSRPSTEARRSSRWHTSPTRSWMSHQRRMRSRGGRRKASARSGCTTSLRFSTRARWRPAPSTGPGRPIRATAKTFSSRPRLRSSRSTPLSSSAYTHPSPPKTPSPPPAPPHGCRPPFAAGQLGSLRAWAAPQLLSAQRGSDSQRPSSLFWTRRPGDVSPWAHAAPCCRSSTPNRRRRRGSPLRPQPRLWRHSAGGWRRRPPPRFPPPPMADASPTQPRTRRPCLPPCRPLPPPSWRPQLFPAPKRLQLSPPMCPRQPTRPCATCSPPCPPWVRLWKRISSSPHPAPAAASSSLRWWPGRSCADGWREPSTHSTCASSHCLTAAWPIRFWRYTPAVSPFG
mmetsp:Transcript_16719/g.54459  ORF Transcript_16719/g.54459 Transcript_16719/m.54459 type:complete len:341 (+) Transcript_16719:673-1695(+)